MQAIITFGKLISHNWYSHQSFRLPHEAINSHRSNSQQLASLSSPSYLSPPSPLACPISGYFATIPHPHPYNEFDKFVSYRVSGAPLLNPIPLLKGSRN